MQAAATAQGRVVGQSKEPCSVVAQVADAAGNVGGRGIGDGVQVGGTREAELVQVAPAVGASDDLAAHQDIVASHGDRVASKSVYLGYRRGRGTAGGHLVQVDAATVGVVVRDVVLARVLSARDAGLVRPAVRDGCDGGAVGWVDEMERVVGALLREDERVRSRIVAHALRMAVAGCLSGRRELARVGRSVL